MSESDSILEELVQLVRAGSRYQSISIDLVRQVGRRELAKGYRLKEAIKTTRSKLHQVAVAYQENPIAYDRSLDELSTLPARINDPALKNYCLKMMGLHASTAERLPILDSFFQTILSPLLPIHSILDLACGLTPLALPWMPVSEDVRYDACDIYSDMTAFINCFFDHIGQTGRAELCDLTQSCPTRRADVAFLLKSVPCLEQLDKQMIPRLLQQIPARHIVVSFPARSLGGHQKGMEKFYSNHFETLVQNLPFTLQNFIFPGEIVYLINRSE
jgi:16S rRNA (guanine(1405)-N(7))-methyltransferase